MTAPDQSVAVERYVKVILLLVIPIAALAWLIEWAYSRITGNIWRFSLRSTTYYFLLWCVAATALLASPVALWMKAVAFYILLALQIITLNLVAIVPLGSIGGFLRTMRRLSRRSKEGEDRYRNINRRSLWIAVAGYMYTMLFFGAACFMIYLVDPEAYEGGQLAAGVNGLFDFIYMSFIMMVTMNYTEVTPASAVAKIVAMGEFSIGLLFTLLIFSLFVDKVSTVRSRGAEVEAESEYSIRPDRPTEPDVSADGEPRQRLTTAETIAVPRR